MHNILYALPQVRCVALKDKDITLEALQLFCRTRQAKS